MRLFSSLILTAHMVQALQISWYDGSSCTSEELYAATYTSASKECYTFSPDTENTQSIVVAFESKADDKLNVVFYSDDKCKTKYEVEASPSVCVADEDNQIHSYKIVKAGSVKSRGASIERSASVSKRSPQEVQRDIDAFLVNSGLDLSTRDADDLSDSGKTYAMDIHNGTGNVDLRSDHPFISATAHSVVTAIAFSSLVVGCIGVGGAGVIGSYACGSSLAVTCISFISALYHTYHSRKDIVATLKQTAIKLGLRKPTRRGLSDGSDEDDYMMITHEEYMEHILHSVGLEGRHLGYHKRSEDDLFDTPAYHFSIDGQNDYVLTISADENGEVKHSISFAHDVKVDTRRSTPGYQGVKVKGGVDVEACQQNSKAQSTLPSSAKTAYSYFIQDFQCLVSSSQLLKSNYVNADIMNPSGLVALTVGLAPYKTASSANEASAVTPCTQTKFYFDQTCVY